MVVCWEHDWKDCKLEVIELKSKINELENQPVPRPTIKNIAAANEDDALKQIYDNVQSEPHIREMYETIVNEMKKVDPEIWTQIGTKYIGMFSPEKAFASILVRKKSIGLECYTKGEVLEGTKISNIVFSPMWISFSIKNKSEVKKAVENLKVSYLKIKEAVRKGENTAYFTGGYSSRDEYEKAINGQIDMESDQD